VPQGADSNSIVSFDDGNWIVEVLFSKLHGQRVNFHVHSTLFLPGWPVMSYSIFSWFVLFLSLCTVHADDWPQWRGPDRSNVSREKGLADQWPAEGPPLAWKITGLGDGVTPVAVVKGCLYSLGNVDGKVVCAAWAEQDGKPLWKVTIGEAAKEMSIMRWLSQTSPLIDGDRLYAVTAHGDYVCLESKTGKEIWRKHLIRDFQGTRKTWGYCDYPLVDGDNLILTPGGKDKAMVAVNKFTGEHVWACSLPAPDIHAHAMLMAGNVGGKRFYVNHLAKTMVGVSAQDGKLLWQYEGMGTSVATTHAPIIRDDEIFYVSGYGAGRVLLKVQPGDTWTTREVYRNRSNAYVPWLGCPTAVGEGSLLNTQHGLQWIDWKAGTERWHQTTVGRYMHTIADDKVYVRTQKGKMLLGRVDAEGWKQLAEFSPPLQQSNQPSWTFPVIAQGHLYIRDYDHLYRYDIRAVQAPRDKEPDAVFVPTPSDVVQKMLELAEVKKTDVVYDLGSGDGRIVIAAAKRFGCQAKGVEISKDLVEMSRSAAREAGVETLATFELGDLFEVDFSTASVVALYILPNMCEKLTPKLNKLKPGARVVSHCFAIPGIKPDRIVKVKSDEDDIERTVYLYTIPLKRGEPR